MERLADKLVVLVACLPALVAAAGGTAGVGLVVALLAAVALAALCELARGRAALVPPLALCALACVLPEAAALLGVAAYDLCRVSAGERGCVRAVPAAVLVPLAWGAARGVPDGRAVLLAAVGVVVGGWLGLRVGASELRRRDALRTRDDLAAARLALVEKNRELLDAQDYEVRLATLAERARIARDIHDNVGHLLTRAVVQAEAYRVVHVGEPAEKDLAAVALTVREALDEVRASVHDLRDDACDLSVQVRAVVERACAGTALAPTVRVEAGEAPAAVAGCLTAVAREAVSNVLRHSSARHVSVELVEHPGLWRLTVTDDGTTPAGAPGSGPSMGLASMEERVRALGGTFRAGPGEGGGWTVFASVPRGREAEARGARGDSGVTTCCGM